MAQAPAYFGKRQLIGGIALVLLLLLNVIVRDRNVEAVQAATAALDRSHETVSLLRRISTSAVDAETGVRGFVITGSEKYLEPYNEALPRFDGDLARLEHVYGDTPEQSASTGGPSLAARRVAVGARRHYQGDALRWATSGGGAARHRAQQSDHGRGSHRTRHDRSAGARGHRRPAGRGTRQQQRRAVERHGDGAPRRGGLDRLHLVGAAKLGAAGLGGGGALRRARAAARHAGQHRRRRDRHRYRRLHHDDQPGHRADHRLVVRRGRRRAARAGVPDRQRRHAAADGKPGHPGAAGGRDRRAREPHAAHRARRHGASDRRLGRGHPRGVERAPRRGPGLPRRHRRPPRGARAQSIAGAPAGVVGPPATSRRRVAHHQRRGDAGQHRRGDRRRSAADSRRRQLPRDVRRRVDLRRGRPSGGAADAAVGPSVRLHPLLRQVAGLPVRRGRPRDADAAGADGVHRHRELAPLQRHPRQRPSQGRVSRDARARAAQSARADHATRSRCCAAASSRPSSPRARQIIERQVGAARPAGRRSARRLAHHTRQARAAARSRVELASVLARRDRDEPSADRRRGPRARASSCRPSRSGSTPTARGSRRCSPTC